MSRCHAVSSNLTGDGSYTWDAEGRPVQGSGTVTYTYNGLGQLADANTFYTRKNWTDAEYLHDEAGHVTGVYTSNINGGNYNDEYFPNDAALGLMPSTARLATRSWK